MGQSPDGATPFKGFPPQSPALVGELWLFFLLPAGESQEDRNSKGDTKTLEVDQYSMSHEITVFVEATEAENSCWRMNHLFEQVSPSLPVPFLFRNVPSGSFHPGVMCRPRRHPDHTEPHAGGRPGLAQLPCRRTRRTWYICPPPRCLVAKVANGLLLQVTGQFPFYRLARSKSALVCGSLGTPM